MHNSSPLVKKSLFLLPKSSFIFCLINEVPKLKAHYCPSFEEYSTHPFCAHFRLISNEFSPEPKQVFPNTRLCSEAHLIVVEREGTQTPSFRARDHTNHFSSWLPYGSPSVHLHRLTHTFNTRGKHINKYSFACAFYW